MMKKFGIAVYPGNGLHKIHMIHVEDVASLILEIAEKYLSGYFNAAARYPLAISEWIDHIQDTLEIPHVFKISLPLLPIRVFTKLS